MKTRFPLYAKVLVWLMLNFALLLVIGAIFATLVLPSGRVFGTFAVQRVARLNKNLFDELRARPYVEWDLVLGGIEEQYPVSAYLFHNNGSQLSGKTANLPAPVTDAIFSIIPPHRRQVSGRKPESVTALPPDDNDLLTRGTFLRTQDPMRHWVVLHSTPPRQPGDRALPATLVVESATLSAGGLFFDLRPWILASIIALGISVLWWIPFFLRMNRNLRRIGRLTDQIANGRFESIQTVRSNDELGGLSWSVARMARKLSGFMDGQKRFLGDIAHELCAPLSRLQMALGILEAQRGSDDEHVKDLRDEVDHMSKLVNELMSFSKAGLKPREVRSKSVSVSEVARKAAAREHRNGIEIDVDVAEDLRVLAEPELLSRALSNLIRNSIRYAGGDGPIWVRAGEDQGEVWISIGDHGPGVPDIMLAQIFEPFYRTDPSRSRDTGGAGLGLAIVKSCVTACGGSVTARNCTPSGLEVTLRLKAANGA